MPNLNIKDLRRNTGELIDRVLGGERFTVYRFDRPVAALVSITDLDRLEETPMPETSIYHLDQGRILPSAQALADTLLTVHHGDAQAAARALLAHIQAEQAALALLLANGGQP